MIFDDLGNVVLTNDTTLPKIKKEIKLRVFCEFCKDYRWLANGQSCIKCNWDEKLSCAAWIQNEPNRKNARFASKR